MKNFPSWALRAERVALTLALIMFGLVVVHLLAMQFIFNESIDMKEQLEIEYWHFSIFDLDEEESFGTWFSAVILLIASTLSIYFARQLQGNGETWHRWWKILGYGFCFMSIDEVVGLHELLNTLLEDTPWTVIGLPVIVVVGLCYLPFLWHYRWRTATLLGLAGITYGIGAVGVEHFSGTEVNSLQYNMWTGLEECMEMLGVIIFIYTILDLIRSYSASGDS